MSFHEKHSGQSIHHNTTQEPLDPDTILNDSLNFLPENYQPSKQFNKRMDKLLRKSQRMSKKNKLVARRFVPKIAIAATVLLCSFIAVQAHNDLLFGFWSQKNETHTAIELIQQNRWPSPPSQFKDVPVAVYFPRYLPDGYSITDIHIDKDSITFLLEKGKNQIWIIQTILSHSSANTPLDDEEKKGEKTMVGQMDAVYYIKDSICCLTFSDSQSKYLIKGTNFPQKELIRIAESFEIVS